MSNTVTDITRHPDFEPTVALLRAEIERLSEINRNQREQSAQYREQLATTTAELRSLAADKIALNAQLYKISQQHEQSVIQQKNNAELCNLVQQLTKLQVSAGQLQQFSAPYNDRDEQQHAIDMEKLDICKQNLRELKATHQATVAELKLQRNVFDKQQVDYAEDQRKADAHLQHLQKLQVRYHEVLGELRELRDEDD